MLLAARDPNVQIQTEDISTLKRFSVLNCVKMSMILCFYYDEARRFSDEICLIFESFIGRS